MNFPPHRHRHRRGQRQISPDSSQKVIRIALAGNPNSGKTSLFNAITGQHQHIGNYPGVTVEKKYSCFRYKDDVIEIIDLPGTYSLTAYSLEEIVARDFVIKEKPDVIIDVLDATNLERQLYLLLQFQELGVPLVGALNMSDECEKKGIDIDHERLSSILGIPLVKTVGTRGYGIDCLLDTAIRVAKGKLRADQRHLNYGEDVENAHDQIIKVLETDPGFSHKYPVHWLAIKLLENDRDAIQKVKSEHTNAETVLGESERIRRQLENHFHDDIISILAERRYAYINGAIREAVRIDRTRPAIDWTERIDRVILNRFLGIPIFLLIMFLIYQATFGLGNPLAGLISNSFANLADFVNLHLPDNRFRDFLTNGLIAGVGGVLVFLPLVVLLMLGLSLLEDTGYMARAAFVMDKFFHLFGLHGRSFIPLMLATGCAVPGVMAARSLANRRDRIITIMVTPLMMCSAKTPVIAMLAAAFFPEKAGLIFWGIWFLSWFMALIIALIFRKTFFKGDQSPFVMELPPYRWPSFRSVMIHMWQRTLAYLRKAGTIILFAAIIVWSALHNPTNPGSHFTDASQFNVENNQGSETVNQGQQLYHSYAGQIGRGLEPILKWAGFDWKIGVSLIAGLAAKEVIISTLGMLYGIPEGAQEATEQSKMTTVSYQISRDPNYSPLSAFSLMIFVMLYTPCLATLAVVRKELGHIKWALFQAVYTVTIAFIASVAIFQIGTFLQHIF